MPFRKGWIQVQDVTSAFVGEIASPGTGSYIIDVCAAPGGKSLHLADLLEGTGMVEARDLTYQKTALIEENMARCGVTNMKTLVWDALEYRFVSHGKGGHCHSGPALFRSGNHREKAGYQVQHDA